MKNVNIINQYKNKILPDPNIINGNYNFSNGSKIDVVPMFNIKQERSLIIKKFFSAIKVIRGEPVFNIGVEKINITLSYYTKLNKEDPYIEYGLNENTLNNLADLLSKEFERQVELRIIKIQNPYLDRNILAEYIGKNASLYNFRRLKNNAMRKTKITRYSDNNNNKNFAGTDMPSDIIGRMIIFSGRLVTERLRPRKTVSTSKIGTFTSNNKLIMESGSFTGKNARGAYTVKVLINHKKGKNYI